MTAGRAGWTLAPGVLRLSRDRLAGGSPFRVVRLSPTASRSLQALLGTDSPPPPGLASLTAQLVRYGLLLAPSLSGATDDDVRDVTVVVPARSAAEPLQRLLTAVPAGVPVVVVDDGSTPPLHGALGRESLTVIRHERARGPAAARNAGAAVAATRWLAFVDADMEPGPGWLARLLAVARADPEVVAVGPRVRSGPSAGLGGFVEEHAGGLDLGSVPADVARGGPVSYLPSALLLVDREAFWRAGGFDERLHVAEDVDLVWRLLDEGVVRYAPDVVALHAPRPGVVSVLRRRAYYGSGAALLEARHPGAVRHADVSVFSLVPWLLGIAVRPWVGAAVAAATVALAPRTFRSLPARDALRLAGYGQGLAVLSLGRYALRPLWPLTLLVALVVPARRRVLAGVALSGVVDLVRRARREDAAGWRGVPAVVGARLLDDVAYSLGVWEGALRHRRWAPLLPRVRGRTKVER